MGRRWWIASGLLLGALALVSFVLTRAADQRSEQPTSEFAAAVYGPAGPGPAAVRGALLVVLGLLVAVAALAYAAGRRRAQASAAGELAATGRADGPEDVDPTAQAVVVPRAAGRWWLPVALGLALLLVSGGLLLVRSDPWGAISTARGIAPLDNVAGITSGDGGTYAFVAVSGVVPEVAGLPYGVAVTSLQASGFTAIDVRDRDGEPVGDQVPADRIVDRVVPGPGSSPSTSDPVVLYLR